MSENCKMLIWYLDQDILSNIAKENVNQETLALREYLEKDTKIAISFMHIIELVEIKNALERNKKLFFCLLP